MDIIYFRKGTSMIGKRISFFIGVSMLTIGVLASCQSTATPTLAISSQPGISVGISDDSCPNVVVEIGQQISWTNQGTQDHMVRASSVEGASAFDSGTLRPGESFAVTLAQADIYQYECSADGSLTGTITLKP
jgi:plastocyanin